MTTNNKLEIGTAIEHGGMVFIITKINIHEDSSHKCLEIQGFDSDTASKNQIRGMKQENAMEQLFEMFQAMMQNKFRGLGGDNHE